MPLLTMLTPPASVTRSTWAVGLHSLPFTFVQTSAGLGRPGNKLISFWRWWHHMMLHAHWWWWWVDSRSVNNQILPGVTLLHWPAPYVCLRLFHVDDIRGMASFIPRLHHFVMVQSWILHLDDSTSINASWTPAMVFIDRNVFSDYGLYDQNCKSFSTLPGEWHSDVCRSKWVLALQTFVQKRESLLLCALLFTGRNEFLH